MGIGTIFRPIRCDLFPFFRVSIAPQTLCSSLFFYVSTVFMYLSMYVSLTFVLGIDSKILERAQIYKMVQTSSMFTVSSVVQ